MSENVTRLLDAHAKGPELIVRKARTIEPKELDTVWSGVLWAGKPTLVAGDPGLGKSMVTCDIAARVTTGDPWPCESERREPANVIMLSAEDDPDDTIVPRLLSAGADLDRIDFIEGVRDLDADGPRESWFALDKHMQMLSETIQGIPKAQLLVIDPISAYMGNTDSHRNSDVRVVLMGLAKLAQKHRVAVLVVSHLNKGRGNAVYRVTGSLAFTAAARAVHAVARDPEDDDIRLFMPVKSNLGQDRSGYRYTIKANDDNVPYVEWGDELETRRIEDIFDDETPRQAAKSQRDQEVVDWLREQLAHEPKPATAMWRSAELAGFSEREVNRGKKAAGVRAEILGFQGAWHWRLP